MLIQGTVVECTPGRWLIRAFAGRGSDGKIGHVNRTVRGSKREAQRALAQLVAYLSSGQVVHGQPMTLAQLVERWLDDLAPQRTPRTVLEYRRVAEHDILPALGTKRTDKLTARDIDVYYRSLLGRGLSPASVRRHHALLHASLGRAVKSGLVGTNPADRTSPPATRQAQVEAPAVDDVIRLIKAATFKGDAVLATAMALARHRNPPRGTVCAQVERHRLGAGHRSGSPVPDDPRRPTVRRRHQDPPAPRHRLGPGHGGATAGTSGAAKAVRPRDRDGASGRRVRTLDPRRWLTAVPA